MSRYVDISELEIPEDDCCYADLESFVEAICESEYIDIVRCGECKWSKANGTYQWCGRLDSTARITADDFCSYGERRDDE
jgi:hypothetical protein